MSRLLGDECRLLSPLAEDAFIPHRQVSHVKSVDSENNATLVKRIGTHVGAHTRQPVLPYEAATHCPAPQVHHTRQKAMQMHEDQKTHILDGKL
jgi:hypothetical protein